MADDFAGVPAHEWHEVGRDARRGVLFGWLALCLALLLVFTLIERGVLSGWSDLFHPVAGPASG